MTELAILALALVLLVGHVALARRGRTPFGGTTTRHDVFVSYKSTDVALARAVVDRLLACGITPWFAEYEVLFRGRQDDAHIRTRIEQGVSASEWGLVLAGDQYTASDYCRFELGCLRSEPSRRLLHVRLAASGPPDLAAPTIDLTPLACEGIDERVRRVLRFLEQHTGWNLDDHEEPAGLADFTPFESHGLPFMLDVTGWQVKADGWQTPGIPKLRRYVRDHVLHMNVTAGPDRGQKTLASRVEKLRHAQESDKGDPDRELYDAMLRATAEPHLRRLGARAVGVHLYMLEGFPQLALTYRGIGWWARKYSLILPIDPFEDAVEFVFTFGFMGDFREYCAAVPFMDKLIYSLRPGPPPSAPAEGLLRAAFQALEKGNEARALLFLSTAIANEPGNPHIHNEAGACLVRLGRYRAARRLAEQALDPKEPKFRMSLLTARFGMAESGGGSEAGEGAAEILQDCDALIETHPLYPSAHLLRAELLAWRGESRMVWERSIEAAAGIYRSSGVTASGTPADAARIATIVEGCRRRCQQFAARSSRA